MASTYTSNIRLEKQADGENPNSWGLILNQNVIDLIDDAITAYTTVSLESGATTGYALTANSGASDQARSAFIQLTGNVSANVSITIPGVTKGYIIRNTSTEVSAGSTITVKTAAGTGISIPYASAIQIVCDSVSVHRGVDSAGLGLGTASTRNVGTSSTQDIPDVSISDTRYARLSATNTYTNINTYTCATSFDVQVNSSLVSLTDAASIALDLGTGNHFIVQLGGNRTLQNPTNGKIGQVGHIYFIQDGTGSRTLAYGDMYKFPNGTAPTLSTSVNAVDMLVFSQRGTSIVDCAILKSFG
jgi:hypothetical protein